MREIWLIISIMDLESIIFKMEMYMKVNGKIINSQVKEDTYKLIHNTTRVNFKTTRRMATEYIII
jgi:hypothetical protein